MILAVVALVGLLGVPRAVTPSDLPAPRVHWPLWTAEQEADAALLRASQPLPLSVRTVGELLRRVGQSEFEADTASIADLRDRLRHATKQAAEGAGGAALVRLRALQTHLFLHALSEYRTDGTVSADLRELSGALLLKAERGGWLEGRRIHASDAELAAMFRLRWGELTGLAHAAAFRPTLNDLRLYYAHRLRYPEAGESHADRASARLRDVEALGRIDPSYPADYAAGILLYRLGAVDRALERFRAHLRAHPDGAWTLRARNYATACAEQLFTR